MKRLILAILCSVALLALAGGAIADQAFDQDMASRYLRAAQSGDDEAQFYLGSLYSAGIGVPRSDQEAFRWFSRAANQGHSHAMLILAGLYATGRGVEKNNVEAYKWAYIVNGASRVDEFRNGSRQLMGVLEKPDEPGRNHHGQEPTPDSGARPRPAGPPRPRLRRRITRARPRRLPPHGDRRGAMTPRRRATRLRNHRQALQRRQSAGRIGKNSRRTTSTSFLKEVPGAAQEIRLLGKRESR